MSGPTTLATRIPRRIALILPALARRHDVADHRYARDDQTAAADSLERAERDQLGHVLREPAERGADRKITIAVWSTILRP